MSRERQSGGDEWCGPSGVSSGELATVCAAGAGWAAGCAAGGGGVAMVTASSARAVGRIACEGGRDGAPAAGGGRVTAGLPRVRRLERAQQRGLRRLVVRAREEQQRVAQAVGIRLERGVVPHAKDELAAGGDALVRPARAKGDRALEQPSEGGLRDGVIGLREERPKALRAARLWLPEQSGQHGVQGGLAEHVAVRREAARGERAHLGLQVVRARREVGQHGAQRLGVLLGEHRVATQRSCASRERRR
eukprot:7265744-Prymnesium_polylepis.1